MLKRLINKIDKLNENLEKSKINEIADILDNKVKLFFRNYFLELEKVLEWELDFILLLRF